MTGLEAEIFVKEYLQFLGWKVLKERYRRIGAEIDLIVYKNAVLSFVEVKFRSHSFSDANEVRSFLPKKKRKSLVRGASFFLTENNVESFYSLRFDLVVLKGFGNKGHLDFFYIEDVFCGDSLCFH